MSSDNDFWQKIFAVTGPFDVYGSGGMDPLQRNRRDLVIQICRLIDYPQDLEVSVAALHAITDISDSFIFAPSTPYSPHKLFSILESASELPYVMECFLSRLEREETEAASITLLPSDLALLKASGSTSALAEFGITNIIRLQILEFLITNVTKPFYNLSHYLLGISYGEYNGGEIKFNPSQNGIFTCWHIIIELMMYGYEDSAGPIILVAHPSLALKCYDFLTVMLKDARFSRPAIAYLRNVEDFYQKHISKTCKLINYPSDGPFDILQLKQRASMLAGAAIDLYSSINDSTWGYAIKLSEALIVNSPTQLEVNDRSTSDLQTSLFASLLCSAFDTMLSLKFINSLDSNLKDFLYSALDSILQSASLITRLILRLLSKCPYDRNKMIKIQSSLITSLIPFLGRLSQNSLASGDIISSCSLMLSYIAGDYRKLVSSQPQQFVGDEAGSITTSLISLLLRPDCGTFSRGIIYAALTKLTSDSQGNPFEKELPSSDLAHLVSIVCHDSALIMPETISWAVIASEFLCFLLRSSSLSSTTAFLFKSGYIKNMISSIRQNERAIVMICTSQDADCNYLYLWRLQWSILELISLDQDSCEKLIDLGITDLILELEILGNGDNLNLASFHNYSFPLWLKVVQPVISLLENFSYSDNPHIREIASMVGARKFDTFKHLADRLLHSSSSLQDDIECEDIAMACLKLLRSSRISDKMKSLATDYLNNLSKNELSSLSSEYALFCLELLTPHKVVDNITQRKMISVLEKYLEFMGSKGKLCNKEAERVLTISFGLRNEGMKLTPSIEKHLNTFSDQYPLTKPLLLHILA